MIHEELRPCDICTASLPKEGESDFPSPFFVIDVSPALGPLVPGGVPTILGDHPDLPLRSRLFICLDCYQSALIGLARLVAQVERELDKTPALKEVSE